MREDDLRQLERKLTDIKNSGWIKNRRPGNVGGVGNTLEDLLEVAENNFQLPDFGEWELKSQRSNSGSLLTLFHSEPKPRSAKIVPEILLKKYGWPHSEAGIMYPANEKSFRQTINAVSYSDRGFKVNVNYEAKQVQVVFNYDLIDDRHSDWRESVKLRAGESNISPVPFWLFDDIEDKLHKKLNNMMYVEAESKVINGEEYFKYTNIDAYIDPSIDKFLNLIETGCIYVDFDARTGHNHGTKFRIKPEKRDLIYSSHISIK